MSKVHWYRTDTTALEAYVASGDMPDGWVDVSAMGPYGFNKKAAGASVLYFFYGDAAFVQVDLGYEVPAELRLLDVQANGTWRHPAEELYASWRACSFAARVIASYFRCHPKVAKVSYPGLKDDPGHDKAARVLIGGFGPELKILPAKERERWQTISATAQDPREQIVVLEKRLGLS